MRATPFTRLIECDLPLQLAGMGGVGTAELALAVSAAGGLGMIPGSGLPADALERLIVAMTARSTAPFGVNFLMPFLQRECVEVAARNAHVVEFFYGEPDRELVSIVHEGGARAGWQVGSANEASAAQAAGCDYVVAQGIEAGGHVRGSDTRDAVVRATIDAVEIPVVAAGGIGTARDVREALDASAAGVRVGTRFVVADECDAHPEYASALIGASAADTVLTVAFAHGWPNAPHRVLRSAVEAASSCDEVAGVIRDGEREWPVPRYSTMPPTRNASGNIAAMALYAGESVDAVTRRQPAAAIVAELVADL